MASTDSRRPTKLHFEDSAPRLPVDEVLPTPQREQVRAVARASKSATQEYGTTDEAQDLEHGHGGAGAGDGAGGAGDGDTSKASAGCCDSISIHDITISATVIITVILWVAFNYVEPVFGNIGVIALFPILVFGSLGYLSREDFNGTPNKGSVLVVRLAH